MIKEGEIIEIPVENPTYFTNAKQPDIGIIVFSSLTVVLLLLANALASSVFNIIHLTYLRNLLKLQPSFEVEFLLDILYINQKIYLRNLSLKRT